MLNKIKNRKQEGFTIIEVLIVLAIAGLIMLVVFLAVPALQRNSRNTQRQNDAGRVSTAVSNWVSNNNGKVFVAGNNSANVTAVINDAGTLGQYTLTTSNLTVATGAQTGAVSNGSMAIVTGAQCGDNGVTVAGTARQYAVRFAVESGTGVVTRCING